jgi:hypothetical protein
MKIQTLLYPGKYHPVYCEDHLLYHHLGNEWFVGGVMDGCSSGEESHFASALYVKSTRKACRQISDAMVHPDQNSHFTAGHEAIRRRILYTLFEDMQQIRTDLSLDMTEMLSTLLLLVYRIRDRSAWINVSGDGLVFNDGERTEIDQDNMPDYLAFHLDTDVEYWYHQHTATFTFSDVRDLTISTDGLLKLYPGPFERSIVKEPVEFLIGQDTAGAGGEALQQRLTELLHRHGYIPFDDIGVLRILP